MIDHLHLEHVSISFVAQLNWEFDLSYQFGCLLTALMVTLLFFHILLFQQKGSSEVTQWDLELLYGRIIQWAFLESKARKCIQEQEKQAMVTLAFIRPVSLSCLQVALDSVSILTGNGVTSYFHFAAYCINMLVLGHVWVTISL